MKFSNDIDVGAKPEGSYADLHRKAQFSFTKLSQCTNYFYSKDLYIDILRECESLFVCESAGLYLFDTNSSRCILHTYPSTQSPNCTTKKLHASPIVSYAATSVESLLVESVTTHALTNIIHDDMKYPEHHSLLLIPLLACVSCYDCYMEKINFSNDVIGSNDRCERDELFSISAKYLYYYTNNSLHHLCRCQGKSTNLSLKRQRSYSSRNSRENLGKLLDSSNTDVQGTDQLRRNNLDKISYSRSHSSSSMRYSLNHKNTVFNDTSIDKKNLKNQNIFPSICNKQNLNYSCSEKGHSLTHNCTSDVIPNANEPYPYSESYMMLSGDGNKLGMKNTKSVVGKNEKKKECKSCNGTCGCYKIVVMGVLKLVNKRNVPGHIFNASDLALGKIYGAYIEIALNACAEMKKLLYDKERIKSILSLYNTVEVENNTQSCFLAITSSIKQLLNSEDCIIYILNRNENSLFSVTATCGENFTRPADVGFLGTCIELKHAIVCDNAQCDERYEDEAKYRGRVIQNILCVPLLNSKNQVLGAIEVVNKYDNDKCVNFSTDDVKFLSVFSKSIARKIKNSSYLVHSQKSLNVVSEASAAFDPSFGNYARSSRLKTQCEKPIQEYDEEDY